MASQVITTLVDDLDGSEAEETIQFGLDGKVYEIDLNSKNATNLRGALDKFVDAARTPSGPSRRTRTRSTTASTPKHKGVHDPKVVRAWAIESGFEVPTRGRLPKAIIEAYEAAD